MKICAANGTLCISLIYKLDFVIGLNCTRRTSREGKESLLVSHCCVVNYSVGFSILHWEAEAVAGWLPPEGIRPTSLERGPSSAPLACLVLPFSLAVIILCCLCLIHYTCLICQEVLEFKYFIQYCWHV